MLYLILITFGVFIVFWWGDLYLTLITFKHLKKGLEINPVLRYILKKRGKLIYLSKTLEILLFLTVIWFLGTSKNSISFYLLLIYILIYSFLVVNNAHVYYKATKKESKAFRNIFLALVI